MGAAVPSAVVVELIAPGQHEAAGVVGVGQLVAGQDLPLQLEKNASAAALKLL
jgi:hypothetical protein